MFSVLRVAAVYFVTASCFAQSAWNGTWTVNQAKSTLKPPHLALERIGDQYTLHYDSVYTFACEGKEYPTSMGLTVRCQGNANFMSLRLSIPGHLIWRWTFTPSVNGKTMNATISHSRVGKSPSIEKDTYTRASGTGSSLVGSWTGTVMHLVTPDSAILRLHDGFLYYRDTWDGNVSDAKLDGTPAPWLDPHLENEQWSNKLVNPRRIVGHALVAGKPVNTETLELAPDGKTLKLWLGNDESQYQILDKQ